MSDENKPNINQNPSGENAPGGVPRKQGSSSNDWAQKEQPASSAAPEAQTPVTPAKATPSNIKPDVPANSVPPVSQSVPTEKAVQKSAVEVKKPASAMPTRIGKEITKQKSNAKFLVIMGLGFAGLFVAFIVLMVLVIAKGGGTSPVLQSFGIDSSGIRSFLLTVINISFGLLALFFFVLSTIGVFKILFAKKGDKEARNHAIRMTLTGVLPLAFAMFIWLFLYNFISKIEISTEVIKAEILITNPTDLTKLEAPLTVTFSSKNVIKSLQNNKLNVQSVKWDFNGDGVFETTPADYETSYLYNLKGNYNVGLDVDVGEAKTRQYFKTLSIKTAVFSAKPYTGTAPLKVDFDATNLIPKKTEIQSLDWDFEGDGTYDSTGTTNIQVSYTYKKIGTYKAHLRYLDTKNIVENYYKDIIVTTSSTPLLSAKIKASPALSGVAPLQILFDGKESASTKGKITNYEWDFGEGGVTQKGQSVSYTYNKTGTYTVTLTVTDDSGATDIASAKVEVKITSSKPVAIITTTPTADKDGVISGEMPLKVSFDSSKSTDADKDIVSYEWDINGSSKYGQKIDYTFDKAGTYTITLKVTDADKQIGSATVAVKAKEPGVKSVIKASPESGSVPLTVGFDGSSSSTYKGSIVSYEWDFGDSSAKSITGASITHKYDKVGSYTVSLKITTSDNETNTATKTIYVREVPLKACFSSSRNKGPAPLSVTFDSQCSTGSISTYSWDFADGKTSASRKIAHTFEDAGTYNVTLEVSDGKNNISKYSDTITVDAAE